MPSARPPPPSRATVAPPLRCLRDDDSSPACTVPPCSGVPGGEPHPWPVGLPCETSCLETFSFRRGRLGKLTSAGSQQIQEQSLRPMLNLPKLSLASDVPPWAGLGQEPAAPPGPPEHSPRAVCTGAVYLGGWLLPWCRVTGCTVSLPNSHGEVPSPGTSEQGHTGDKGFQGETELH